MTSEQSKRYRRYVFPDREIIQIYARDILIGGGNIHCITHQIPSFVRKETPYDK